MTGKRKENIRSAIKLLPHEKRLLEELYLAKAIPVDQYLDRVTELRELTDDFNAQSGHRQIPDDIRHYMKTMRKRGMWVRFDGAHQSAPPHESLTADEMETLIAVYSELVLTTGNASDVLSYDEGLRDAVANEFSVRIGRRISPTALAGKIEAMRKRGLLPRIGDVPQQEQRGEDGFEDINEVG